jgi:hypothetical protein
MGLILPEKLLLLPDDEPTIQASYHFSNFFSIYHRQYTERVSSILSEDIYIYILTPNILSYNILSI